MEKNPDPLAKFFEDEKPSFAKSSTAVRGGGVTISLAFDSFNAPIRVGGFEIQLWAGLQARLLAEGSSSHHSEINGSQTHLSLLR